MSDKPISVGDLVQVVRCCCSDFVQGRPTFHVVDFWRGALSLPAACTFCKSTLPKEIYAWTGPAGNIPAFPISWLKRIPPLAELESEKHDEKLPEPA